MKEMRLRGVCGMDAGNAYLPTFMADYNRRLAVAPRNPSDSHRGGAARRTGAGPDSVRAACAEGDDEPVDQLRGALLPGHCFNDIV